MDSFSGDQWRDRWKGKMTISCDYSDALIASNTQWRCLWGFPEKGWSNSSSFRAILQQRLCSRGRLACGKDQCMDLLDRAWLVCSDCIVLRAWYDQLCMRIVTWSLWHILYTDSWDFQLQAFPLNSCVNVCEFLLFHVCIIILFNFRMWWSMVE